MLKDEVKGEEIVRLQLFVFYRLQNQKTPSSSIHRHHLSRSVLIFCTRTLTCNLHLPRYRSLTNMSISGRTSSLLSSLLECHSASSTVPRAVLSKSCTLLESSNPNHRLQASLLLSGLGDIKPEPHGVFRLGITGPPGAGKSTFIEALGNHILSSSKDSWTPESLSVLSIDPTSPLSRGSILADATRMSELQASDRTFIRPSPSSLALGGITTSTADVLALLEPFYPLSIIESVGAGQNETEVTTVSDLTILLLPPASGDGLQGVKKGVVELSDMIVVNKADGDLVDAARRTASEYGGAVKFQNTQTRDSKKVSIVSSLTGDGIAGVWDAVCEARDAMSSSGELKERRSRQEEYWAMRHAEAMLVDRAKPALADAILGKEGTPRERAQFAVDMYMVK